MKSKTIVLLTIVLSIFCMTKWGWAGPIRQVDARTLSTWMGQPQKVTVIDTGSFLACMDTKIPGAVCLPCGHEKGVAFFSSVSRENKIVFYAANQPPDADCDLIRQAEAGGFKDRYVLKGGLAAWRKAGNPVVSEKRIPRIALAAVKPKDLSAWKKTVNNPLVVDIRSPKAFAAGHLDGAVNFPLTRLHVEYAEIPLDRTLLMVDEDGTGSLLAASYLARKGFPNVRRLKGGMAEYRRGAP